MKVLALAVFLCLGSCAGSQPPVQDARLALATAVGYAQAAAEATKVVCTIDPQGKPCDLLLKALDAAFEKGAQIEAALNAGQDMADDVEALEQQLKAIYDLARRFVKELA